MAMMKAARLIGPGEVRLVEAPVPEPRLGQVRVRLRGCGVCASNVPPFEGRAWFTYPMPPGALGHEGWGVVDRVGEGVDGLEIGQPVAMLSQSAYAQFDVAEASNVVPLPLPLADRPFPAEPLACAVNVARRSGIVAGDVVAIVGTGFLGTLLCRLVGGAGATILACTRRESAGESAKGFGADEVIVSHDRWEVGRRVRTLTAGRGADVTIECTGHPAGLDLAGDLVREHGRLIIAGYHQDGLRQVNLQQWNWKGLDVINAHERDDRTYVEGMRRAVSLVAAGKLDPSPLLTHTLPLERLSEALSLTRDRPEGFMKALVTV